MKQFHGQTLSWDVKDGIIELALHREPLNEISSLHAGGIGKVRCSLDALSQDSNALIMHSSLKSGFCAGADLRQLYGWIQEYGHQKSRNTREITSNESTQS